MGQKREHFLYQAFINSYSQLFFADHKLFAWLLLCSSFLDPFTGFCGALSVLVAIAFSYWSGLDHTGIRNGSYSFNALMVGLVIGSHYTLNPAFVLIIICSAIISVLFCVMFFNLLHKYKLAYLSLPFLFTLWITTISLRSFPAIQLIPEGTYRYTEWMQQLNTFSLPHFIEAYLKSLSAIFFQYNILVGALLLTGLIIWSRIAFVLSVLGFSIGYFFYDYVGAGFNEILYSFIGFNFILTAIALGGFFVIPSRSSFILAVIAMPVIALLISAFSGLLWYYQLPLYSLPFNIATLLFMLLLNTRVNINGLNLVTRQLFAPEKNLYHHHYNMERYKNETYFHIHPPYYGEWYISQGIDGRYTHKSDWKYAWDFVVTDEIKHTFRLPGTDVTDFYCYNLPVLAPAAGTVWDLVDGIEDNEVGDVDIRHNWGNTIIIKHGDFFYSKLSHLKKDSIKVKVGDYVQKGELLGNCGSSGRSPEPHIHFQLQSTPYIGSKTLLYPISYYMTRHRDGAAFHAFDYPQEGESVSAVNITPLLAEAFNFIPGVVLTYEVQQEDGSKSLVKWEVVVDALNHSYLYCQATRSFAYFVNNGTLHYFTEFVGDRSSMLYHFYLAANKVLLGYYDQLEITDKLPVAGFYSGISRIVQDFIAPFYIYLEAGYTSRFTAVDDAASPKEIRIESRASIKTGSLVLKELNYGITVSRNQVTQFDMTTKKGTITATCTG